MVFTRIVDRLRVYLCRPLVGFLLAGGLIFLVDARYGNRHDYDRVMAVTAADIEHLADLWRTQSGRDPSIGELHHLLDNWLREELYYREALRLGLDREDTIVKRRLVQKLAFLREEADLGQGPGDVELEAFYQQHKNNYWRSARYSFQHIFIDAQHNDLRQHVQLLQRRLQSGHDWRELTDAFMLHGAYSARDLEEVKHLFGEPFAQRLAALPADVWSGPVTSVYGNHLVRVVRVDPRRLLRFGEVKNRVLEDYVDNRKQLAEQAYLQELQARYGIDRAALEPLLRNYGGAPASAGDPGP